MEQLSVIAENVAYILSISFQLSAAWMLVGNTSVTRNGIIKAYCANQGSIPFDKEGKLLSRSALESVINTAWTNKIAFVLLGLGYFLNIFGNCTIIKSQALIAVLLLTITLVIASAIFAKKKSKEFESPTLKDIPLLDGVQIEIVGDEECYKEELLK